MYYVGTATPGIIISMIKREAVTVRIVEYDD